MDPTSPANRIIREVRSRASWLAPLLGAVPILLVSLWLLGGADLDLFAETWRAGAPERFYDDQGQALARGELAVACEALRFEAIELDGRCHGYFGIFPALLRAALNAACADCAGHWNRLASLAAMLTTYAACLLLARHALAARPMSQARRLCWASGFAGMACLGSTEVFVAANPIVYHEAIQWGVAFTLLAFWSALRYRAAGRPLFLAVTIAALLCALNSRITIGLGASIGVFVLWAETLLARRSAAPGVDAPRLRWPVAAAALVAFSVATPFAVNLAKFGALSPPLEHHVTYRQTPLRLAVVRRGLFQLSNLPCTVGSYLSPSAIDTYPAYPWVIPAYGWTPPEPLPAGLVGDCGDADLENVEPFFAIYYGAPALVLLAVIGCLGLARAGAASARPILALCLGAGLGALPVLLFATLTYRYEHDLFPLLVLAASVGIAAVSRLAGRWRQLTLAALVVLTLAGLHINMAAVFDHFLIQPEAI